MTSWTPAAGRHLVVAELRAALDGAEPNTPVCVTVDDETSEAVSEVIVGPTGVSLVVHGALLTLDEDGVAEVFEFLGELADPDTKTTLRKARLRASSLLADWS